MKEIWLRITLAALFSLIGVFGTYQWSRSHRERATTLQGATAVARIESAVNEVQRRPAERLVWQGALSHQELYPGEAVRTASNAEARIEFLGQGTVIELDPDTVIEIHKTDGAINLDFLKGNLFIRSAAPDDKITVKSGEEKIAVANSEVVISKPTAAAKLDIDVVKGDAKGVKVLTPAGEKPLPEAEKDQLKVLAPQQLEIVYLKPDPAEPLVVAWEKLDKSYAVKIEVGSTRTELKALDGTEAVGGEMGRLELPIAPGKSYLRLVAESSDAKFPPLKSPVVRFEVRPALVPVAEAPAEGARTEPGVRKVEFQWSNPGGLEELMVEVARSRDLKEAAHMKRLGTSLKYTYEIPGQPGSVYWRVSGRLPQSSRWISSPVKQLYLSSDRPEPLPAPALKTPERAKTFSWVEGQGTIWLKWEPVKDATGYEVTFTDLSKQETVKSETPAGAAAEPKSDSVSPSAGSAPLSATASDAKAAIGVTVRAVTTSELSVQGLKPGRYTWSVIAKDDTGRRSASSETRALAIEALPPIRWADGKTSETIITENDRPQLKLAWLVGPEKNLGLSWRTRIVRTREPASADQWKTVKEPRLETTVDGRETYQVEVEALAASGQVVASAPVRTVEFQAPPRLKAPELEGAGNEPIQGTDTGSAEVQWKAVPGAKSYRLTLKSSSGEVLKTIDAPTANTTLTGLRTGDYQVVVEALNRKGEAGEASEPRVLKVPEYSDVPAPKLKKVNIN